jgi:hypothetical protein
MLIADGAENRRSTPSQNLLRDLVGVVAVAYYAVRNAVDVG